MQSTPIDEWLASREQAYENKYGTVGLKETVEEPESMPYPLVHANCSRCGDPIPRRVQDNGLPHFCSKPACRTEAARVSMARMRVSGDPQ